MRQVHFHTKITNEEEFQSQSNENSGVVELDKTIEDNGSSTDEDEIKVKFEPKTNQLRGEERTKVKLSYFKKIF